MAIRKYKPTTPGRRGSSVADFAEITRSTPEKSLLRPLAKTGGRNNQGRITTRHIGGGHKRQYRVIDFRRNDKDGIDAKVAHIEYDPNRTARIALLHYFDGEKRYILAPNKLSQGDVIESVTKTGTCLRPSCTAMVWPIMSGTIIDRRDQVLMTLCEPFSFSASTFLMRWSSTKGPFFRLRGMSFTSYPCRTCGDG